jgi:hypothetical protein
MRRTSLIIAAVAATTLAVNGSMTAATARPDAAPHRSLVAKGLITPLSFAVKSDGTLFIAENFAGLLVRKKPGKAPKIVFAGKEGDEVGAVSTRNGVVTFAHNGKIKQRANGNVTTLANVGSYEAHNNPDAVQTYGFESISDECAAQLPAEIGPPSYTGVVDAHPYGTAVTGDGTYVADAGGNDILKIADDGTISTVTVLPVMPAEVTAELAAGEGLPDCTIGLTYDFEPVPTDVEMGTDGMLYVTLLPGGPEDPSGGARGAVVKVHPVSGHVTMVADGLLGATGLGVASNGDIYVAQLFAGQISKIPAGSGEVQAYKSFGLPAAVEIRGGILYATVDVLPPDGAPPNGRLLKWGI